LKSRGYSKKRMKTDFLKICCSRTTHWTFVAFAALLAAGCNNMDRREVGGKEFIALYDKARYSGDYWEYKGKSGDYHIMMHYSYIVQDGNVDGKSIPTAYEKVMVKADQVPVGFPSSPQKKMIYPAPKLPELDNMK